MTSLKIVSMNCRGLGNQQKRKDIFNFLRNKGASIFCLQDSHFTANDHNYTRTQPDYYIFHSPGSSDSRGVAVLFNNDFEYKLINEKTDALENYISLELEIDNAFTILLINIYGANLGSPQFYSNINDIICASTSDFYILCGNFNLVQEFELDCLNYKNLNNPRA